MHKKLGKTKNMKKLTAAFLRNPELFFDLCDTDLYLT